MCAKVGGEWSLCRGGELWLSLVKAVVASFLDASLCFGGLVL